MLQLRNQPLLEIVMGNAVVFSRMKSHQKGQIMDLLGSKGLHHVYNGQQHHFSVSYCILNPPVLPHSVSDIALFQQLPQSRTRLQLALQRAHYLKLCDPCFQTMCSKIQMNVVSKRCLIAQQNQACSVFALSKFELPLACNVKSRLQLH